MRNNWTLLNCGTGEVWRRLDGTDRVLNEEELHKDRSRRTGISFMK
jgi:hypothetical protein